MTNLFFVFLTCLVCFYCLDPSATRILCRIRYIPWDRFKQDTF